LREAWLWFNAIQGHVASLYVDPKATVRGVNQCSIEVNNWLNLLVQRVGRYGRDSWRQSPGYSLAPEDSHRKDARKRKTQAG
jgi:hypothetical protein